MAPPIPKPPPGAVVTLLMTAIGNAHVLPVLVKLGVFDRLAERPRGIDDLAEATGAHAPALGRVMAFCRSWDLVSESGGVFALTESGRTLVRGDAPSYGDEAALRGTHAYVERWANLEATLRGSPRRRADVDLDALEQARVAEAHRAVLADYAAGFARSEKYVDIESGDPALLAAILKKSGRSEGVYIAKAPELERAKEVLAAAGVAHRCELVLPQLELPAADAYLFSHRLEALGDDEAIALLSRARRAMNQNGRVLVIGHVRSVVPGWAQKLGTMIDLEMLLLTPAGKMRSDDEVRALCAQASLEPKRTVLAGEATQILEAAAGPVPARVTAAGSTNVAEAEHEPALERGVGSSSDGVGPRGHGPSTKLVTEDDAMKLRREIARYPDDLVLREMWAGLAERRGEHARARLVREQLARRASQMKFPQSHTYASAVETELLEAHPEWAAELATFGASSAELSGGFVESIVVDAETLLANGRGLVDSAPIRRVRLTGNIGLLPRLVREGVLDRVCWLDLSGLRIAADLLASLTELSQLRALGLERAGVDDALVETIWASFPRLLVCVLDGNPCTDLVTKDLTWQEMSTYEWFMTDHARALAAKYGERSWIYPSSSPMEARVDLEMLLARIAKGW